MDQSRIQKILSSKRVLQVLFFIAAVALVTYFFPGEGKFRYTFQEGKPWKYGLLTAPFDFPIYKDEAVIQQEKDSIMLGFQPVFSFNEAIGAKSTADFEKSLTSRPGLTITPTLRKNLVQALRDTYHKGIVKILDFRDLLALFPFGKGMDAAHIDEFGYVVLLCQFHQIAGTQHIGVPELQSVIGRNAHAACAVNDHIFPPGDKKRTETFLFTYISVHCLHIADGRFLSREQKSCDLLSAFYQLSDQHISQMAGRAGDDIGCFRIRIVVQALLLSGHVAVSFMERL